MRLFLSFVVFLLLVHVPSVARAEDPPAEHDPAVSQCIIAKPQASAAEATHNGLHLQSDVMDPKFDHDDYAACLYDLKRYEESLTEWDLYATEIADKDDETGLFRTSYLEGKTKDEMALGNKAEAVKLMNEYFDRMHGSFLFDRALYLHATAGVPTPGKAANRAYLMHLSADQRAIVINSGGTLDYNEDARPCHISIFDTVGKHKETWWYCKFGTDDQYEKAYDFVNGKLISAYTP